jgi:hypothetical protein
LALKFVNVGVFTTKTMNVVHLFFFTYYNLGFKDFNLFGFSIYKCWCMFTPKPTYIVDLLFIIDCNLAKVVGRYVGMGTFLNYLPREVG